MRGSIANAVIFAWLIYAAGFAIWLFGYLSAGHPPLFDWNAATPWLISSFVPNLEAELGLALMFAGAIPIYGRAAWGNLARLFAYVTLLLFAALTLGGTVARAGGNTCAPLSAVHVPQLRETKIAAAAAGIISCRWRLASLITWRRRSIPFRTSALKRFSYRPT
jgi:hypothetical protein